MLGTENQVEIGKGQISYQQMVSVWDQIVYISHNQYLPTDTVES